MLSQKVGISRFTQVCINQGIIEQTFLDFLAINGGVKVERNVDPESLVLDHSIVDDKDAYPITIRVRHVRKTTSTVKGADTHKSSSNGVVGDEDINDIQNQESVETDHVEVIKAKYLIGCDGAHSWTRRQLGLHLEGEQSNHIWGVMDIIPLTDFRKIRALCRSWRKLLTLSS